MRTSLEALFSASYLKPALRTKIGTNTVYIGDGWVPPDQLESFNRTFPSVGLEESQWVTFWMAEAGKGRMFGAAMSFDTDAPPSQPARIEMCLRDAKEVLSKMKALH